MVISSINADGDLTLRTTRIDDQENASLNPSPNR
jgi:hypothetical protein